MYAHIFMLKSKENSISNGYIKSSPIVGVDALIKYDLTTPIVGAVMFFLTETYSDNRIRQWITRSYIRRW